MDQNLSVGLFVIQLVIILKVVCTFQGVFFPQIFHKNLDGSINILRKGLKACDGLLILTFFLRKLLFLLTLGARMLRVVKFFPGLTE